MQAHAIILIILTTSTETDVLNYYLAVGLIEQETSQSSVVNTPFCPINSLLALYKYKLEKNEDYWNLLSALHYSFSGQYEK